MIISLKQIFSALLLFFLGTVFSFANPVPLVSGTVIDEVALSEGGLLLLSSFKPGPGAEANEQTDKIGQVLLKGIQDILSTRKDLSLNLVDDSQEDSAAFVLDGYIEEFNRSGKMARLLMKNHAQLSVNGEIWLKSSGSKVLVFSSSAIINLKKVKTLDAAYQMGRSIGKYIAQEALKE